VNNRKEFFRLTCVLAVLVPVPGRLAYGIITILLLIWVMTVGSLLKIVIQRLRLEDFEQITTVAVLAALVVIFRQFLTLFSPVISLTMSFSVYIIGFSSVVIGGLFSSFGEDTPVSLSRLLHRNIKTVLNLIPPMLAFYALRDILGYGTLTLPATSHLLEWKIMHIADADGIGFWGTAGGAFILLGIYLGIYLFCTRKLRIAERS
jgi:Na+-transporting NADH:ubiquinone oxidoreductase subunit NqrD